ncbi:MAG: fused MFS/spermidine synthase [Verrucomicrobiota bacterium]
MSKTATKLTKIRRLPLLATLLGFSGACGLVYQMAWLREFRLVFGGATPATAAALAIFMGALGAGGALFGRRAETSANPLRLYALLEMGVGLSALATPLLLGWVRALYLGTGGIAAMGLVPATLLQLLLATVVLATPCLLMGGSLPAAFKWVETEQDRQRGVLGILYGVNTLGALAGVVASTFWLLDQWGIRATVTAAAWVNLLLGAVAWMVACREDAGAALVRASRVAAERDRVAVPAVAAAAGTKAAAGPIYLAAGITGCVFFLSEMVWFRMLAPLLGSSVYGFGLILALALAGIGLGGLLYRAGWGRRTGSVTLGALAWVAGTQALLLAVPWALGDRIAVFAFAMTQLHAFGLPGLVVGWTLVSGLLVLGPSLMAGMQFPLLVGLLGEGTRDAGRHVGFAYAANTLGAIVGSLAGGFVLLPWLTAPGCWCLAVGLTLVLSLAAGLWAFKADPRRNGLALVGLWAGVIWLMAAPTGPTAVWRHQPIGYGRVEAMPVSPNGLGDWLAAKRRKVVHEFEGREASIAVVANDIGYSFNVNGKSDGAAFGDAETQVMLGLLPAMLHPAPRRAFVVGLGTGSTAGWLAEVPGMERVDVAEIEPGMAYLARHYFAPVNRNVMAKSNVKLLVGDAREALLVAGPRYDLIVSEPSNPCRAGVSTLFTREFYAAAKSRLETGGLFAQWLQGYEVDSRAVRLVYATLITVFPYVETWMTKSSDLVFIGFLTPPAYPMEQLRQRVQQAPFAEALARVWFTRSAEGVLAHHLASPEVARRLAQMDATPNTDDRNRLEYSFARALVQDNGFDTSQLLHVAMALTSDVPAHLAQQVDRVRLQQERQLMLAANETGYAMPTELQGDERRRAEAVAAFVEQRYPDVLALWTGTATRPMEQLMLMESAAKVATPEQLRPLLEAVATEWPADARFAAAQTMARQGAPDAAAKLLREGFTALRTQVWSRPASVQAALSLVASLTVAKPEYADVFLASLREPFPAGLAEASRMNALVEILPYLPPASSVEVVAMFEPNPPWTRLFLELRLDAYRKTADARAKQADRDLQSFLHHADLRLDEPPAAAR